MTNSNWQSINMGQDTGPDTDMYLSVCHLIRHMSGLSSAIDNDSLNTTVQ